MKIGFFGGCFNPPTNVHIDIASELIKKKIVDKVIFIPIGDFYKKESLLSITKRCKMLELAIESKENIEIDNFEKDIKTTIYAVDAFKLITEKYSNHDIYFIMGSDNFNKIQNWKDYEQIIDKYKYIVIKRNAEEILENKENIIIFIPKKQYNYDSTVVRARIKEGKSVENLIDKNVLEYIKQNDLYKKLK